MHYVLYHQGCYDGFGAAWAAYQKLGDSAEYIPVKYGEPIPDYVRESSSDIFILDFSYPPEEIAKLKTKRLVMLDHHKSAMDDWDVHIILSDGHFINFDMNRSGAGMAWDYFHPAAPRPKLINYVEDRDLWRFKLRGSREIHTWLQSFSMSFYMWDCAAEQLERDFEGTLKTAETLQQFKDMEVKRAADQARTGSFIALDKTYYFPLVNASNFFSEVANELLKRNPEAPFAAYYFDRADGKRQWGLRSEDAREDVAKIAKALGGGGHRNAAGFITPIPGV